MKINKIVLMKKILPQSAKNLFRRVLRQWEKSGKLPGKTNPTERIIKLNQQDNYNKLFLPISRITRSREIFCKRENETPPSSLFPFPRRQPHLIPRQPKTENRKPKTKKARDALMAAFPGLGLR
jgi:hypothetical protein